MIFSFEIFLLNIEMHDEAERASRKAMAVIAPETNETSEVREKQKINIFYCNNLS
jgi:hypothetical protein